MSAAEFVTAMDVLLGEVPEEGGQLDALVTQMLEHPFGLLIATQVRVQDEEMELNDYFAATEPLARCAALIADVIGVMK